MRKIRNAGGAIPDADRLFVSLNEQKRTCSQLTSVTTYVSPEQGWEDVCRSGAWQGRPVRMKTMLTVTAGEGGAATGGGAYDSGAKVTLKATPAKGYVFAGWYEGGQPMPGLAADYRQASQGYTVPARNVSVTARFVTAAEDRLLIPGDGGDKEIRIGEGFGGALEIDSESFPTVTVSGLPAGVRFDAKTLTFSGSPTKAGVYAVTVTAKNAAGYTYSVQERMVVTGAEGRRVVSHFPVLRGRVGEEFRKPDGDRYFDVDLFDFDTAPEAGRGDGELVGFTSTCPGLTQASLRQDLREDPSYRTECAWYIPGGRYSGPYHPLVATPAKAGNYAMSLRFRWADGHTETVDTVIVVDPPADGDFPCDVSSLGAADWEVGRPVGAAALFVQKKDGLTSLAAAGLPAGVKLVLTPETMGAPASYSLSGSPTKVGSYAVTLTAKSGGRTYTAARTVRVVDSRSEFYSVLSADPSRGTATGGGVLRQGAKMAVNATAKPGCYFAGWYRDAECATPACNCDPCAADSALVADHRTASQSWTVLSGVTPNPLYARFVTKEEDSEIGISGCFGEHGYPAGQRLCARLEVASATFPTVTASGLPAGVRFDAKTLTFSGVPTKPGEYAVRLTAKNLSGRTATATLALEVHDYLCTLRDLGLADSYEFIPGVAVDGEAVFGSAVLARLGLGGWTVTGLPAGLRFDAKTGSVVGAATAENRDCAVVLTRKYSDGTSERAAVTFRTSAFPVLSLVPVVSDGRGGVVSDEEALGAFRLTGGRGYAANTRAAIGATAAKGYVFAGWYADAALSAPAVLADDWRKAANAFLTEASDRTLYGRFATAEEDAESLRALVEPGYVVDSVLELPVEVESLSLPSLSVSGLPAGLRYDAKSMTISGQPTKPGEYEVTLRLSNLSARGKEQRFRVVVPNLRSDLIGGLRPDVPYELTAGVSAGGVIGAVTAAEGYSLSASGLPAGLRFDARTGLVTGAPTAKPGSYTVTFTAKRGSHSEVATVTLRVAEAPAGVSGTYSGFAERPGGARVGTFQLVADASGRVSAKVVTAAKTYGFSATFWEAVEGSVYVLLMRTSAGDELEVGIDSAAAFDADQLAGTLTTAAGEVLEVSAQASAFGGKWHFRAEGGLSEGWRLEFAPSASEADLTLALKADGTATLSGRLGTYALSLSAPVSATGMREGYLAADFLTFQTLGGAKRPFSVSINLWFDRSNDHGIGVGEARFEE